MSIEKNSCQCTGSTCKVCFAFEFCPFVSQFLPLFQLTNALCFILFFKNLFIHYHLLLLAGMGIVCETQISVAVKLTFCGEKICPWGKEIGSMKKKEALVLAQH